jgi:hypothetical protein
MPTFAPLHLSLQNFTDSQFFAQLFRHSIVRPQAAQVFAARSPLSTSRLGLLSGNLLQLP